MSSGAHDSPAPGIAIVGMAGRFPGARDVETFWRNIKEGRESITRFPKEELEIQVLGADDDAVGADYVCAKGVLDDIDQFDPRFFGYLPREAELMDPQHRVFLELCWEALENAGCDAARFKGAIGVWGGCYMDTYVLWNLCSDENFRRRLVESIQVGSLQTELGNDKDYLATRVAFKLGLTGPAMTVQTACSTSLVAIVEACKSLDTYACDMALAGGVTIVLPQKKGYFYKEGSMLSRDGACRTFDADAAGTVFSNGAAVVVLKRLDDAVADGDAIYGVIRGYASNNDGAGKVSYTSPSVEGQSEVISLALRMAGVSARTIGYVEAHGTATPIGDPIEVAGLTAAYRRDTDERTFCAIGSLKANLGHLDVSSGAIGLIKTALALKERVLPPQINFTAPNPRIDFPSTPFFVNTTLRDWPAADWPRRAGVSSFGVGGTNAHLVVEEPPPIKAAPVDSAKPYLFVLSAKSEMALEAQATRLADRLARDDAPDLADAVWTLQTGRRAFEFRRAVVANSAEAAVAALRAPAPARKVAAASPSLVFVFPGQGAQYPGMGARLYATERVYRQSIDEIAEALRGDDEDGIDIRDFLLWTEQSAAPRDLAAARLAETSLAQPAIFAVEMALARLLEGYGVRPAAVIGHSVGEFAAAVIAGVMSVGDAARLVAARGRLMQALPAGRMLAIRAPREILESELPNGVQVAAVNSPGVTVVSGPVEAIEGLKTRLDSDGVGASVLHTSHAFHSGMMTPAASPLADLVSGVAARPASIEIFSTVAGAAAPATCFADPAYWGRQLTSPVLFADAVRAAGGGVNRVFLEVGPGQALTSMIRQTLAGADARPAVACLGPSQDPGDDSMNVMRAIGDLWCAGLSPDWTAVSGVGRRRVGLPTYPFERRRCWIEPTENARNATTSTEAGQSGVEGLIQKQLDVIAAQLRVLKRN